MAEIRWSAAQRPEFGQRGAVDRWGRPLTPPPDWTPGPVPPDEPPPDEPLPDDHPARVTAETPFRHTGGLTSERFVEILDDYDSPMVIEAVAIHKAVKGQGLPLAQSYKESQYGTTNTARYNPLGLKKADNSGFLEFSSWADAFKEWQRRMDDPTYKGGVYMPENITLKQFIYTYAGGPGCWTSKGKTCANGETKASIDLYLDQTIARLNRYLGFDAPEPTPTPVPGKPPVIYSLANDYARFGLSKQEAQTMMGRCFSGRSGVPVMGLFCHVQEGTTAGSLNHWLYGGVQASSTVMIQHDGSVLGVIAENNAPWTNGDTCNPTAKGQGYLAALGGGNPNLGTVSIEFEGYYNKGHEAVQLDAGAWQLAQWMARYGLAKSAIYRHSDVNSCSRANCCGDVLWNGLMARL